jgi:hypothetical protein
LLRKSSTKRGTALVDLRRCAALSQGSTHASVDAEAITRIRSFLALSSAVNQDTLRLPCRTISRPMFPLDPDFEADLTALVVK